MRETEGRRWRRREESEESAGERERRGEKREEFFFSMRETSIGVSTLQYIFLFVLGNCTCATDHFDNQPKGIRHTRDLVQVQWMRRGEGQKGRRC